MEEGSDLVVGAFAQWGKRLPVRFVLALGIMLWVSLLVYGGIWVAKWLLALTDEPPKYDFMFPQEHPEAVPLGLVLVAWPVFAGVRRMLRYGWKIRPLRSSRFEKALLAHFSAEGWESVRRDGGALPARGVPFSLGGEHTVFATIEKVHRGRTARIMYYGVAPIDGGDPLNRMFTIVAVFTDADSPVTMAYPQRGAAAVKAALGATDVDTESAEFNGRWRLVSHEPRAALEVMQPLVMERLLEEDAKGLTIAWDGNAAMVVRRGVSKDFAALERALDVLVDVADRMPAYQTKSGARGARVSQGSFTVGSPPKYRPGPVEFILGAFGILLAFGYFNFPERIVPEQTPDGEWGRTKWAIGFLCLGVVLAFVGILVGLARGRRQRRAWADHANAMRSVSGSNREEQTVHTHHLYFSAIFKPWTIINWGIAGVFMVGLPATLMVEDEDIWGGFLTLVIVSFMAVRAFLFWREIRDAGEGF